jgi:hypothetical protein
MGRVFSAGQGELVHQALLLDREPADVLGALPICVHQLNHATLDRDRRLRPCHPAAAVPVLHLDQNHTLIRKIGG